MAEHYAGDDTNVRTLLGGVLAAFAGISVDDFEAKSDAFLRTTQHPTLGRPYLECAYAPMVELLDYLEANGFANYIASGGGRDFMRPISHEVYGIPRERGDRQRIGARVRQRRAAAARSRTSRRPTTSTTARRSRSGSGAASAAGRCSPPATPTATSRCSSSPSHQDKPFLPLLVLHDDAEREFDYTGGAEQALERAGADGWTVVSIKNDWATVFPA